MTFVPQTQIDQMDGVTCRMTGKPEIQVQPCPTASTGFDSGVRRASSAITSYVPFKKGTTKFDMEFAVFGHKMASDTKGRQHENARDSRSSAGAGIRGK
jgi:hypothetical protein